MRAEEASKQLQAVKGQEDVVQHTPHRETNRPVTSIQDRMDGSTQAQLSQWPGKVWSSTLGWTQPAPLLILIPRRLKATLRCSNQHLVLCRSYKRDTGSLVKGPADSSGSITARNVCEEWEARGDWPSGRTPAITVISSRVLTDVVLCCTEGADQ